MNRIAIVGIVPALALALMFAAPKAKASYNPLEYVKSFMGGCGNCQNYASHEYPTYEHPAYEYPAYPSNYINYYSNQYIYNNYYAYYNSLNTYAPANYCQQNNCYYGNRPDQSYEGGGYDEAFKYYPYNYGYNWVPRYGYDFVGDARN